MSIIGKYTVDREEDNQKNLGFTLPATAKKSKEDNLKKDIVISTILHPTVVGLIYLISFILLLLGIKLSIFDRPKPKMKDIEFVLVEKEGTPINKNTPYRSDINSRAGGHHDPTKPVSMPSPAPADSPKPSPAPQPPAKAKQPAPQKTQTQPKQQPVKKPTIAEQIQQAVQPKPEQPKVNKQPPAPTKAPEVAKPAPPTAKPSIKPPLTPKPTAKPSSAFQVPVPSGGTKTGIYATGPISGSGTSNKGGGSGGPISGSGSGSGTGTGNPGGERLPAVGLHGCGTVQQPAGAVRSIPAGEPDSGGTFRADDGALPERDGRCHRSQHGKDGI